MGASPQTPETFTLQRDSPGAYRPKWFKRYIHSLRHKMLVKKKGSKTAISSPWAFNETNRVECTQEAEDYFRCWPCFETKFFLFLGTALMHLECRSCCDGWGLTLSAVGIPISSETWEWHRYSQTRTSVGGLWCEGRLKMLPDLNSCSYDPSCLTYTLLSHCCSVDIFSNFVCVCADECVCSWEVGEYERRFQMLPAGCCPVRLIHSCLPN